MGSLVVSCLLLLPLLGKAFFLIQYKNIHVTRKTIKLGPYFKQEACGVVAHERLTEPRVTME